MNALELLAKDEARSNRVAPVVRRAAAEAAQVQARYEAAFANQSRSYLPAYIQGAREDINTLSRQEILRRARYFEKNSNVVKKALSVLGVNIIGTGINPTPATSNSDWSKRALDWWCEWATSTAADVTGISTIPEMQDIVCRAESVDGDHGIELTLNEFDRPALNLVESHRIVEGGVDIKAIEAAGYMVVDGVVVAPSGRPLAYLVANEFNAKKVSVIPASRFVFFFTKRRAGQYRGISLFDSAILDLHDLDDLQKYEMTAAKDAASKSTVIKSLAGGNTLNGTPIGRSLTQGAAADPSARAEYYKNAITGETIHLFTGDEMQQYRSERPSAATTGFWDRLENKFVQGSGLSYAALCDYRGNWGGATLRAAVAGDNRLFSLRTTAQARKWQKVWEYGIGWAQDHGELPRNPEYRLVRWHPPQRTTVDIGNESAAMLNELKAGTRTYETIYGEAGNDWRERLRQRALEEKFINDLAEEFDVDPMRIASFAQERMALVATGAGEPAAAPAVGAKKSSAENEETGETEK